MVVILTPIVLMVVGIPGFFSITKNTHVFFQQKKRQSNHRDSKRKTKATFVHDGVVLYRVRFFLAAKNKHGKKRDVFPASRPKAFSVDIWARRILPEGSHPIRPVGPVIG